jgi:hypothetical protein
MEIGFPLSYIYHMMGGMARVFSYDTKGYAYERVSVSLVAETNRYYLWGMVDAASHFTALQLTASNLRNQFNVSMEYGWNKNLRGLP